MPSELNRRAVFAALAAFVLALAVAYALSSTGEASEVSGVPGAPAQPPTYTPPPPVSTPPSPPAEPPVQFEDSG